MNFSTKKGEIFGFLGPSGAGKSTTQKIIIGILKNYHAAIEGNGNYWIFIIVGMAVHLLVIGLLIRRFENIYI